MSKRKQAYWLSNAEWAAIEPHLPKGRALLVACGVSEFGRIVVEQGTAVGRTSFISVEFGEGTVCISGAGVVTASGCIRVAR
jgi:hypothetical protein